LTARLPGLELVCHAPIGPANIPLAAPPLFPLVSGGGPLDPARRGYFAWHVDAVPIGGGDLMRFDVAEPTYDGQGRADPLRPYVAFLDFLWTEVRPTIAARQATEMELEASKEILRERQQAHNARVERLEQRTRRLVAEALRLRSIKQDLEERHRDIEGSAT
jgi:hypothetical protein